MYKRNAIDFEDTTFEFEFGLGVARASGSALVRAGDTHILAVVDANTSDTSHFQLSTDFRAKNAAFGQIPGNYLRRETRPSDAETLMSRLIDRALRPLFPNTPKSRTVVTVWMLGGHSDAPVLKVALMAASLAIRNAGISMPIVVGEIQRNEHIDELSIAAQSGGLVMIEGVLSETSSRSLTQRLRERTSALQKFAGHIETAYPSPMPPHTSKATALPRLSLDHIWTCQDVNLRRTLKRQLAEANDVSEEVIGALWSNYLQEKAAQGERIDGRKPHEIRLISIRSGMSATAHGATLFQRGNTSALVFATLGTTREGQDVQDIFYRSRKDRFIVNYIFNPFATNQAELGRHMPNRREIGHGQLIKKAFLGVLPPKEQSPYVLRISSEILSADGSSSMASVMGASFAMAEAGVPLSAPVVGLSLGLFKTDAGHQIYTDLTEAEDHASAFDLKVTGTANGFTAIQLDIKTHYVELEHLEQALEAARDGLDTLLKELTPAWQDCRRRNRQLLGRSTLLKVKKNDVGRLIGSGGKNLKSIQQGLKCRIELSKQGHVLALAETNEELRRLVHRISDISLVFEKDRLYAAKMQAATSEGVRITVDGQYGVIPMTHPHPTHLRAELVVRFLGSSVQGIPEFEWVDDDAAALTQVMNTRE